MAVGWALRVMQEERAPLAELERVLREALTGLEWLSDEQAGQWLRVAWFLVLLVFHRRERAEYTELKRVILEQARVSRFRTPGEVEQMGQTMAEYVESRGEARGLRKALEKLLLDRFGALDPSVQAALAAASTETLDRWFDRALSAKTLAEVGMGQEAPAA
jgi:hypothetical protein